MLTEADTCRKFVVPKLQQAGWENDPHSITEQRYFTDGRIVVHGSTGKRRPGKKADYLLRYTRDFVLAVVEAKAVYKQASDGLQQAKEYAQILGLDFAYATNGKSIIVSEACRALGPSPCAPEACERRSCSPAVDSSEPDDGQGTAVLPANRHQPRGAGHHARAAAGAAHDGDGHGQDGGGVSDLLETVVVEVECKG
jgi:hypothetical protein